MIIDLSLYRIHQKEIEEPKIPEIPEIEAHDGDEERFFQESLLDDREELLVVAFGLMEIGDYHTAIICFEALISGIEPFNTVAITQEEQLDYAVHISRCFKELYFRYQEHSFLIDAVNWVTRAIDYSEQPAPLYNNRGNLYTLRYHYEMALKDYDRALSLNGKSPLYHFNRGNALDDMGDYRGAIKDYNEAIALNPEYEAAIYNRGNSYNQLKEYNAALDDYNRVLTINPKHALSYNNRGSLYELQDNDAAAIDDFTQAIELEPLHPQAYLNRGMIYGRRGLFKKAQVDYEVAIDLNPEDPMLSFHLIELLMITDQYDQIDPHIDHLERMAISHDLAKHHLLIFTFLGVIHTMIAQKDTTLILEAFLRLMHQADRWRWNFDHLKRWLNQENHILNDTQLNEITQFLESINRHFSL